MELSTEWRRFNKEKDAITLSIGGRFPERATDERLTDVDEKGDLVAARTLNVHQSQTVAELRQYYH